MLPTLRRLVVLLLGTALLSVGVTATADAASASAAKRTRCAKATKKVKNAKSKRAKASARRSARRACRGTAALRRGTRATKRRAGTRAAKRRTGTRTTRKRGGRQTTTAPSAPVSSSATEAGLVACANRERSAAGLSALTTERALTVAAQRHAADMAARNYFDHTSLDGRTPWDRIKAALDGARPFSRMGENIAMGYRDAAATCVGWMNSPGHRANILNPRFTLIGAGWVDGHAVQNFGSR